MSTLNRVRERRQRIVQEMLALDSLKRGTLNEQFLRVPQKGQAEPALRGPYYVLSRKEGGKTVSERVAPAQVERVRQDIARYARFTALCREFAELTETLGELEREADVPQEALKKSPNSPRRPRTK